MYSREELHKICSTSNCVFSNLPEDLTGIKKSHKRGRKGGIRARAKRNRHRLSLPSIIFGNVRSLNNKVDELPARVRYLFCDQRVLLVLQKPG